MQDAKTPISNFLEAAAAKQPTPGGGAVAALAGALAAAMGEMVLNYSVTKKSLVAHAEHNAAALQQFTVLRHDLEKLLADDQAAFTALSEAKKQNLDPLPMVRICIDVPKNIICKATQTLRIANEVAATSNTFLLSDLAVCGECAMAAIRAGLHNVAANLDDLPADERAGVERDMRGAIEQAVTLIQKLTTAIAAAGRAAK